jgi:hypothetical protein
MLQWFISIEEHSNDEKVQEEVASAKGWVWRTVNV